MKQMPPPKVNRDDGEGADVGASRFGFDGFQQGEMLPLKPSENKFSASA